jgi:hypothetical protein
MEVALMLKEVEVSPHLPCGVVHREVLFSVPILGV